MGNSPSELGLSIVKGLVSVSDMIFDALIYPFKRGLDFILKLPGMGMVADAMKKVTGGSISINTNPTSSPTTLTNTPTDQTSSPTTLTNTPTDATNKQILDKLDELVSLMKAGGIVINLDGRKVSQGLASVTSY